jgi:hypothetical protein
MLHLRSPDADGRGGDARASFDGAQAEIVQMIERRDGGEPFVAATHRWRHAWMAGGEAQATTRRGAVIGAP